MPLLIDGHNLIAKTPGLRLDDPDDEARLVERLRRYRARTGRKITVFFDAGLPGGPDRDLSTAGVQVIFAPQGQTADEMIIRRLRRTRNPQGVIVVSSDQAIIQVARRRGIRVLRSEVFAAELSPAPASPGQREAIHLSQEEVESWLKLFQERKGEDSSPARSPDPGRRREAGRLG